MVWVPPQLKEFHRLLDSGHLLFNSVDVGVVATRSAERFEVLSLRMTLGYTNLRAKPVLFEDSEWFASRLQLEASTAESFLQCVYTGSPLGISGLPHVCHFLKHRRRGVITESTATGRHLGLAQPPVSCHRHVGKAIPGLRRVSPLDQPHRQLFGSERPKRSAPTDRNSPRVRTRRPRPTSAHRARVPDLFGRARHDR